MTLKKDNSFDKRCQLSKRIIAKYPSKCPIIVEVYSKNNSSILSNGKSNVIVLNNNKYIVESSSSIGQFLLEVRKNVQLENNQAIFLFCDTNNKTILVSVSQTIQEVYHKYKDADGFLYFTIALESVFG